MSGYLWEQRYCFTLSSHVVYINIGTKGYDVINGYKWRTVGRQFTEEIWIYGCMYMGCFILMFFMDLSFNHEV